MINFVTGSNFNSNLSVIANDSNNNAIINSGNLESLVDITKITSLDDEKLKRIPKVATCWVFYNTLGEIANRYSSGNAFDSSQFDSLQLTEQNIRSMANINDLHDGVIDQTHVFITNDDGSKTLVLNKITPIYELKLNGISKYFLSFEMLKKYLLEYVKQNSRIIE